MTTVELTFKRNTAGTVQAAYSGTVRVGYVDNTGSHRWLWSLNTIQPKGGRASGICESETEAKQALLQAWIAWVDAAWLEFPGPTAKTMRHIKAHIDGKGTADGRSEDASG